MAKDPVCGMEVDEKKAAAKADPKGKTYYFCASACKAQFIKEPAKYADGKSSSGCCGDGSSDDCCCG